MWHGNPSYNAQSFNPKQNNRVGDLATIFHGGAAATSGQQSSHVRDEPADEATCDGNDVVLGGEGEPLGDWDIPPEMGGPSHDADANMMDVDGPEEEEEEEEEAEVEGGKPLEDGSNMPMPHGQEDVQAMPEVRPSFILIFAALNISYSHPRRSSILNPLRLALTPACINPYHESSNPVCRVTRSIPSIPLSFLPAPFIYFKHLNRLRILRSQCHNWWTQTFICIAINLNEGQELS